MTRRRIFLWMGLGVLFASLGLCREGLTRETYQVLKGDTLSLIAEKTGITVAALKAANRLKSTQSSSLVRPSSFRLPTPITRETKIFFITSRGTILSSR